MAKKDGDSKKKQKTIRITYYNMLYSVSHKKLGNGKTDEKPVQMTQCRYRDRHWPH